MQRAFWLPMAMGVVGLGLSCGEETELVRPLAVMEVEPARVDFGQVPLGATKRIQVSVRNTGNIPFELIQAETEDPFATRLPDGLVQPGSSVQLDVAFTAQQIDPVDGILRVVSTAGEGSEAELALQAAGAPSFIEVTPSRVDFTDTERFEQRSIEIVVEQRGAGPVEGSIVAEGFSFPEHYALTLMEDLGQPAPFVVAAGSQLVLNLDYQPVAVGRDEGLIRFETCGARCGYEVEVVGESRSAQVEFVPPSLDFSDVGIGTEVSEQLQVRNVGDEAFTLESVVLDAGAPFRVQLERSVPLTLEPGQAVQVVVSFAPTDASRQSGRIVFTTDFDRFGGLPVPVQGRGVGPRFEVLPEFVNFGIESENRGSQRQILMANAGSSQVVVEDVRIEGDASFSLESLPGLPARLGSGESALASVGFSSAQLGTFTATVTIRTDDPNRPSVRVPMVAVRSQSFCRLVVAPREINFGLVRPGWVRDERVQLINDGTEACEMSFGLREPSDPAFSLRAPRQELAPGEQLDVFLDFAPTERRSAKATLLVETNDPATPVYQIPALGTAEDYGQLQVVPPEVRFATGRPQCSRETRSVRLLNVGAIPVEVARARIEPVRGFVGQDFDLQSAVSGVVVPGGFWSVDVTFTPEAVGQQRADLVLEFSDLPYPIRVPLRGDAEMDGQVTESFEQRENKVSDVLFVIDDSCSMLDDQEALARNIESFIQDVDPDEVHYRIGITTVSAQTLRGSLVGPVLDSALQSRSRLVSSFQQQARVGVAGNGFEQGLEAAYLAAQRATENRGFNEDLLRPDTPFTLVVITDEDDQSPGSIFYYASGLTDLAPAQFLSAVVTGGPQGCATAFPAPRYESFVRETNGTSLSLCADWGMNLRLLSQLAFGLADQFTLEQEPSLLEPITVVVNGVEQPTDSFELDAPNFLVFDTPPPEGATIQVTYSPQCVR